MSYFAAGASLLQGFMSYGADRAQAKAQKRMQEFRNKMTYLANAVNQNAITTNVTLAQQQSAKAAVNMRRDEIGATGSASVAAAAAGVRGRSVTATMLNIQRRAGLNEKARTDDLEQMWLQTDQQRLGSAMSAAQQQDYSYIPTPDLGTYLLGAGAKAHSKLS